MVESTKDITEKQQSTIKLDKSIFDQELECTAVKIPVKLINQFQKRFSDYAIHKTKLRSCINIADDKENKYMVMQERLVRNPDFIEFNQGYQFRVIPDYKLKLCYDNFTMPEVLKQTLPKDIETLSGFETIGDIAHLNLSDSQLAYKKIIGQVVMDKNQHIRTVVTKIGQIESTFRFYNLECIGGDPSSFETTVVEDKVRFLVDISKVYWCSKLATERNRVINDLIQDGDVICDMFCGIGPLAVKAVVMKRSLRVLANDLNPVGIEYLKRNIQLNRAHSQVISYNMDARKFVTMCVKNPTKGNIPVEYRKFDHCYMNLPVDAVEFLDVFIGLFREVKDDNLWGDHLPMIHVYGFTFEQTREKALDYFVERIGKAMKYPSFNKTDIECFHNIRDVSPQSHMYSTSFRLPADVAYSENLYEDLQKDAKKQKKE